MADLATLKIAVDSRPVDQASNDLDELATSANRAERATAGLTNQTKATGAAMAGMNNAVRQAKAAQEAAAQAMGGVAGRTKLASHEITNLAFQFQDLGVQIAGGANPLTAFVQQGSQISGIMMQSGMSVGAFTKAVLGMIASTTAAVVMNPVFLGIAAAVGTVTAAVNFMADDITKASGVTVTAGDVMLGAFDVIKKAIKTQVSAAFEAMGIDTARVWSNVVEYTRKAVNIIIGAATLAPRTIITAFQVLPAGIADAFYSAVNFGIRAINGLVERSVSAINSFLDAVNPILEKAGLSIGRLTTPRIAELQNNYAGAAVKAANAFVRVARETIDRDYVGDIGKALKDAAVSQSLQRQAEEGGKKVGDKMSKSAAKAFKDTLGKELADMELAVMNGLHISMRETLKTIDALANGDYEQMIADMRKEGEKIVANTEAEALARRKTNDELEQTAQYLDNLFGLQGNLGGLFKAMRSGFDDVFNSLSNAFGGLKTSLEGLLANMGSSFAKVAAGASIGGIAAKATGGSAAGGAIGGGVGSVLGEKFLTGALTSIGGKKFGEMLGSFAGPLGSIAGGLLGGLIGGLFTKTKQASATLSSIGGQAVVSGIKGNDAQLRGIANNMATGLLKGIANIAEQLGGALGGAVSLSIGQRKKDFVVDPTGQGRTKGAGVINFGEDQAAAIAYATQLAIQQGIITGLSAGANTLIKAGGDLQAQLEKALKFDQVFKDLRKETDPLGAALAELSTEFDKLQVIFKEAGASASDYAALEELYAIKRRKATMEAERPRRELEIQLMELSGDAAGALAAQRKLELAAMDESLRGLQMQVYAMQDLRGQLDAADSRLADAEQALAEARRRERERQIEAMRAEIVQLDAIIAKRDEARNALQAAYDAEVARIDQEISKRQDAISAINETINGLKSFANSIREFAGSIVSFSDTGTRSLATLELQFQQVLGLAATGNQAAMGQIVEIGGSLREAIIANATDRPSMLRQLYGLRSQALGAAENVDMQVMDLQTQADREIAMVALLEQQKVDLANMVNQFLQLNTTTLSVDEAIRQLQTAEAAAAAAEVRKVQLEEQIAQLTKLDENLISIEAAQAEYEAAKKARDEIKQQLDQISFTMLNDTLVTGFADVVEATLSLTSSIRSATSSSGSSGASVSSGSSSSSGFSGAWYGDPFNGYSYFDNLPYFANGGIHNGGLRIVGENGPELEATGPSRIYNANQLGDMMGGGATAEEVKALREELKLAMYQIAKNTGKNYDLMKRWDGDGLPEQRNYAA